MRDLPLVGEEFAGYRLLAVLGRGGMSTVFRAENPRLGNLIALKVMAADLAGDDVFRARFLEESRIAAQLNHPNVIPIHDSGSSGGLLYIAMRCVTGTDLRQMLKKRGRLRPERALFLLSQAARALDAAHRRDLVHRDVKPGNLLVEQASDDADPDHVYLTDFGITKHHEERTGLTPTGQFMGTIDYIAPEQIRGLPVLGLADQYSLGCVLYEALTGRVPFERDMNAAVIWAHVEERPPPPTMLRPELPRALDAVLARVLAKRPGDRYPSCREFMAAAREALAPRAEPPGAGRRPPGRPGTGGDRFPALVASGPRDYPAEVAHEAASRYLDDTESIRGQAIPAMGGAQAPPSAPPPASPQPAAGRGRSPRRGLPARWLAISAALALALAAGVVTGIKLTSGGNHHLTLSGNPASPSVSTSVSVSAPTARATARATTSASATASASSSMNMGTQGGDGESGPGTLAGVLAAANNSVEGHGLLPPAKCGDYQQNASGQIVCTAPVPGVIQVYYQNYSSLTALYHQYEGQVTLLDGGQPFRQNTGTCGDGAVPYAEFAWNMEQGHPHNYTVAQMAANKVKQVYAGGRMACFAVSTAHGVTEEIVWTIDNGPALGVASGSPKAVYELWASLHHAVLFRDTEMCGTTSRMNFRDIPTGNLKVYPACPAGVQAVPD